MLEYRHIYLTFTIFSTSLCIWRLEWRMLPLILIGYLCYYSCRFVTRVEYKKHDAFLMFFRPTEQIVYVRDLEYIKYTIKNDLNNTKNKIKWIIRYPFQ